MCAASVESYWFHEQSRLSSCFRHQGRTRPEKTLSRSSSIFAVLLWAALFRGANQQQQDERCISYCSIVIVLSHTQPSDILAAPHTGYYVLYTWLLFSFFFCKPNHARLGRRPRRRPLVFFAAAAAADRRLHVVPSRAGPPHRKKDRGRWGAAAAATTEAPPIVGGGGCGRQGGR